MKSKIIYANYNPETGKSIVKIQNQYGIFTGVSQLQEEDRPYESSFAGCEYAEMKANISYMKHRKKILDYQIKILKDCYKNMSMGKKFNSHSYEARKIRRKIYELKKEKKSWEEKIQSLKEKMFKNIKLREETLNKIYKIKETGKNS